MRTQAIYGCLQEVLGPSTAKGGRLASNHIPNWSAREDSRFSGHRRGRIVENRLRESVGTVRGRRPRHALGVVRLFDMTTGFRTLAIVLAVLVSVPVAAQTQSPQGEQATTRNQQAERAKERCRLNRGVDCDTQGGLREWLLLERGREESVLEGSRHLLPAKPRPAPTRSVPAPR